MMDYWLITIVLLVPGILLASWIDHAQRRVPNWLNLVLILIGFVVQGAFFGLSGVGWGVLGLLTGLGLLIVPWMMHGMGAGDVKLMAAIGVWLGPWLTFASFACGTLFGGVIAIAMILSTGRLAMACTNLGVIMTKCTDRKMIFSDFGSAKSFGPTSQLLPYGVPLTMGTLLVLSSQMYGWWGN